MPFVLLPKLQDLFQFLSEQMSVKLMMRNDVSVISLLHLRCCRRAEVHPEDLVRWEQVLEGLQQTNPCFFRQEKPLVVAQYLSEIVIHLSFHIDFPVSIFTLVL